MRMRFAGLAVAILACNSAGGSDTTTLDAAAAAVDSSTAGIDSLLVRFMDAHRRRDAAGLAATYDDSSFGIGEGEVWDSAETHGAEAAWKQELPYLSDMQIETVRRSARGDLGTVVFRSTQQVTPPQGKGEPYIDSAWVLADVRRGTDGQWRWYSWIISRRPKKQ